MPVEARSVADALGYRLGQSIVIAHGAGDVSFSLHQDHPFHVVGILARTGTPVDRTVHVPLRAWMPSMREPYGCAKARCIHLAARQLKHCPHAEGATGADGHAGEEPEPGDHRIPGTA